ncbi:hypothetical protein N9444_03455 [Gammaproteobacteria bacterium]|nr:hypothetical protein [Gammaproteobacteria bacterium]
MSVILLLSDGFRSLARQPRSAANFQYILPRLTGNFSLSEDDLGIFDLSCPVFASVDADGFIFFTIKSGLR